MTEWDNTEEVYDEEEELGSHEVAERDFSDHPKLPSRKSVAQILEKVNSDGTMKKIIRARKSDFVHNLIYLDGDKFSFAGRDYLRPVYDRNDRQILLKTARQVEKCQTWDTPVTLSSGEKIPTSELKPGDQVISYNGFSPEIDTVAAVCDNGKRRVLKITTKKKRSVTVTFNHPFRTLLGWVEAKDLKVGRFVALPHKAGFFGDTNDIAKGEVLGHLLAEGHFSDACVSFTQNPGDNLESYLKSCEKFGSRQAAKFWPSRPTVARVASYKTSEIYRMAEGFMKGLKSATLVFPKWIYHADEGTTLGFLRALWGGDGSCKESHAKRNAIDLCYSSTSFSLVDGVQNILLKFGIFSTIRENKPTLYKGTDKKAYILRVIGERSIRRFHSIFGDIPDKSFSIDGHGGKDQSDIIPKEDIRVILNLIKKEKIKRGLSKDTLLSKGLRWSVGYNTQRDKFLKYCEVIQDPILWDIYNAEIYWDEIVSIEDAGEEGTLAVEVERNHNFITGGVITHNTTFLANNLTVSAVVTPYNKALYVSPSHTQTRQFSNEKLRPAIEKSPLIGKYFQDTRVSTQVFEKGFTNGSYIFLRSAFRSADRCVAKGTLITMGDGSVARVESLVGGTPHLLSTNSKDILVSRARQVWPNGEKEIYTVTLESGHEITVSENHRWVTPNRVITTPDLVGEWVPLPLDFFKREGDSSSEYELLGYFLGDGCMAKNSSSTSYRRQFDNNNYEVIEDFKRVCLSLGMTCNISSRDQKGVTSYIARIQERGLFESLLGKFGVLGEVWHNRHIPHIVFGSRSRARDVLRSMFESDGWATYSVKNRQCEVGWVSGSLQLARDVQYCLQGLGIYSTLSSKKPGKNNKSISYNVKIRNTEYISVFRERVGFISKNKMQDLDSVLSFTETLDPSSVTRDFPARQDVNEALHSFGISDHALWANHKISWRRNSTVNGVRVSRHKVEKIYKLTGHKPLLKYLNPQIIWVLVKEISPCGIAETYDISVPLTETFVANGVFTHNTRGISARSLCLDEIQDFLGSEIPVIMECTSHFLDSKVMMAGTPKSFENPIEDYWKSTSQNEWIVKCQSCGKQNFLDEKNIAPTEHYRKGRLPPGPVCKRCQKPIYPHLHGRWVSFKADAPIQGYRIPQLMVPWICGLDAQWEKLLWKRDTYPFGQLYNEVLGLSYDNSSKPITREEIIECCRDYHFWDPANLGKSINEARRYQLTAGVDWGEGNDGSEKSPTGKPRTASYTVLTIGAYINQKVWRTFLAKRYVGKETDPDYIVKDIARICNALGVHLVGVDWGHGWGVNNHLVRLLGPRRVVQMQHLPKLKAKIKWDAAGYRYHLQRNFVMSELFFDIKQKFVEFPKWAEFESFAKDILGIYSEYVEYRREIKYDHSSHNPDDFFHSLLYSKLASDIFTGKSRRFTFDIPDGLGQQGYINSQQ